VRSPPCPPPAVPRRLCRSGAGICAGYVVLFQCFIHSRLLNGFEPDYLFVLVLLQDRAATFISYLDNFEFVRKTFLRAHTFFLSSSSSCPQVDVGGGLSADIVRERRAAEEQRRRAAAERRVAEQEFTRRRAAEREAAREEDRRARLADKVCALFVRADYCSTGQWHTSESNHYFFKHAKKGDSTHLAIIIH
jgi:hypothetical protein